MSSKSTPQKPQTREERLKAALKANMGRRKAQAKARSLARTAQQDQTQGADNAPEKKE